MNDEAKGRRPKIASSFFWVYCESSAAQIVSFIVSIILARLLEPSSYGDIALVTVFIGIANVFVTSSFSYALIQKKEADDLDYNTMFWFNFLLSVVLYFSLFFVSPVIANYYGNPELSLILRVLALRIPASAYNSIQLAHVANHMAFKKTFLSTFGGAIISAVFGIGMAYAGLGIWALVAQNIGNIIFNTIFLTFVVEWRPKVAFSMERLKPMLGFGWRLLVTGLMFTGYSELRTLVVGKRYSTSELGYYDKGYAFPRFIASNIDATITKVLFPAFAQIQDGTDKLAEMTRRAAKTSAYIMTPILFGLAVIAEPMVEFVLTEKWMPCVPYLQIMCLVWWLQPTQSCSTQAIKAIGKSDVYLRIEIISKIIGIIFLIGAIAIFDTVFAIALSMLAGQACSVIIYGVFTSKYIGYRLRDQLKDLLLPAILGGIMCIPIICIPSLISMNGLCIFVQVIVGIIIYTLESLMFHVETFSYLMNNLKVKLHKAQ